MFISLTKRIITKCSRKDIRRGYKNYQKKNSYSAPLLLVYGPSEIRTSNSSLSDESEELYCLVFRAGAKKIFVGGDGGG